jgi:protein O-GlcNAc transferase
MTLYRQVLDAAWQHFRDGEMRQAELINLQILKSEPEQIEAMHMLALIARQTGRNDSAIDYLNAILRVQPGFAAAHHNLGNALAAQQRIPEAVNSFRHALRLRPDFAGTYNSLGNALGAMGELKVAEANLREAVRLNPGYAEAFSNLASMIGNQGRSDEAVELAELALRLKPNHVDAQVLLGNFRKDQGRLDDAIAAYRAAMQLAPEEASIHSNLILALHYHPSFDAAAIFQECRRWNEKHAEPLKSHILPHTNDADPNRRLRVGYVSPHFHDHIDSLFTVPLFSNHDHRAVEVYCYSDATTPDAFTAGLRGYADVWRCVAGLSDQQVADKIRTDQIDILVDLETHMADNRLLVFARKPAPVQVTWLGTTGTTGLSTIDYRLSDPYLDPPGLFDDFYSEQTIRLPETFWCYDPLVDPELPVERLPALENGFITLGCLNNFCKINEGCLALWAKVLHAVPRSRLLLLAPRGEARERALARLEPLGVDRARVEFVDWLPRPEYLKLYNRIDIGLDPTPCNGHTTSLDAFWMGVPTVTLVSTKTAFGRAGWSQLSNLGLQELAAETPEQYVATVVQLASDLPRLQNLRSSLRQRMQKSPLMNGKRFAGHMEAAYRQMWQRWCLGR